MKIGIISDVHGNDIALKAVIDDMEKQSLDGVIFLGDLVAGGPNPKESLELLKKLKTLSWVKGNTDSKYEDIIEGFDLGNKEDVELPEYYSYALRELCYQDLEFLVNKPIEESMRLEGLDILCVHGSPRDIMEKMGKEVEKIELIKMTDKVKERIILCGHSHIPSIIEVNDKIIVNVGSVGFPVDEDNRASYVILELSQEGHCFDFKRVEYNIESILNDARIKGLPNLKKYEEVIIRGFN